MTRLLSNELQILPMSEGHIGDVALLEVLSFPEPYSKQLIASELSLPAAHPYVAIFQEKLVGYLDYWLVADELQLIRMAVHPDFRRRQIGLKWMEFLKGQALLHRACEVHLEVREDNQPAIILYQRAGFESYGRRERYYFDGCAALLMRGAWV